MKKKYLRVCKDCGQRFFTEGERDFYKKHNLKFPCRCKKCRDIAKQSISANVIQEELPENLPFEIIEKDKLNADADTLFIIGNGFDLLHGAKSSYYNFKDFLGKRSELREALEYYIDKEDIWGDFEDSLAHIDRAKVLESLDWLLEDFNATDEEDDDFTYANFYLSIDHTVSELDMILYDLPKLFKKWVKILKCKNEELQLKNIINPNAKYINFNYTEFLETLYFVPKDNILYIHGCRKDKNAHLILGHGHNPDEMYDKWYEEHKNMKVSSDDIVSLAYFSDDEQDLDLWKTSNRYYAAEQAVNRIEEYYENSAKKTEDVLKKNESYFKNITATKIFVIGHSLSFVDYPYFKKIINKNASLTEWYISFHCNKDIKRIEEFVKNLQISEKQIKIFKI